MLEKKHISYIIVENNEVLLGTDASFPATLDLQIMTPKFKINTPARFESKVKEDSKGK